MTTARNVALQFLCKAEPDIGDTISNLKLQKLVYFAQGYYLAMYDKPLFEDPIHAWQHGPVVESLYHEFKKFGSNSIEIPDDCSDCMNDGIGEAEKELINEIHEVYGQYSAWKLRNLTHSEGPWTETEINHIIPIDKMRDFFKGYLV